MLYNPSFISSIDKTTGTDWASISILAHEIGHHLNGHTLEGGSRPDNELEADEFSGFVLRKLGASLSESQLAMKIVADARASSTHPGKYDRLTAIAEGWNNAGAARDDRSILAKLPQKPVETIETNPVRNTGTTAARTVLAEQYIQFDVFINSDMDTKYYTTVANNFVRIKNNELQVLGKLTATNRKDFPLAIVHDKNIMLLVRASGELVNTKGEKIGNLQSHTKGNL